MENSLGLDVHGAAESQDQGQPSDTARSTASPRIHRQEDTADSWGILADTAEQDRSKKDTWDNLGPVEAEDSWGTLEDASTVVKDDRSKKDRDDSWGTFEEEGNTSQKDDRSKKDKGIPYVPAAPPARAKMSPEELAERMEKIRLQNEKIKERREHVKADEEAFNTSVAADRARQAANRKVQAQINQNREQNAKKKLEKMGNREWDSGKHGGEWKQTNRGRGKSSFGSSKDRGRQHTTADHRKAIDISSSATTESDTPLSREETPQITSQNATDSSHPRPDTRDAETRE